MRKAYCCIIIQCLVALTSNAQYQPNPFRVISRSEGLPSPLIHKVYETSDGYFWVATQTGLARYDGRSFEMFYAHYADTNTITANIY
jgi:ligand-binding sensor domain-containing protein